MRMSTAQFGVAIALVCAALALPNNAGAVDLRDWGRKYDSASERFVVLSSFNNEAVLDKETQLVWQRASGSATAWVNALSGCILSVAGGRQGWRLPSISELTSLSGMDRVLPAGHPFQDLSNQDYFWSRTDHPNYPGTKAYTRQLLSPYIQTKYKTEVINYLCVRGVGVADR